MAIFRVTPAHDPSIQIEFEIPIKGRQNPLFFTVPKIQYFPVEKSKKFYDWLSGKNEPQPEDGKPLEPVRRSGRDIVLKMLSLHVSAKDYAILEKLTDGELGQIDTHWENESKTPVGESSASSDT